MAPYQTRCTRAVEERSDTRLAKTSYTLRSSDEILDSHHSWKCFSVFLFLLVLFLTFYTGIYRCANNRHRKRFFRPLDGFPEVGPHIPELLAGSRDFDHVEPCRAWATEPGRGQRLHRTVLAAPLRASQQEAREKTRGQTRKVNYSGKNGHLVQSNIYIYIYICILYVCSQSQSKTLPPLSKVHTVPLGLNRDEGAGKEAAAAAAAAASQAATVAAAATAAAAAAAATAARRR